jgi:hypothetical protein
MGTEYSLGYILFCDLLHFIFALLFLGPVTVILTILSPRIKSRGVTFIILLLLFLASLELHVLSDRLNLKLFGHTF